DQERLHYVEATVVQMKGDCEKLSFVSGNLQKDSEQKQKEIEMLIQSLEKLQKEKADQQDMMAAMDMKADKAALGSKVNRSQFEENMEELDERMKDLQSQISGQEQYWNNTQQQFSDAMEEKLAAAGSCCLCAAGLWPQELSQPSSLTLLRQLPVPFTCLSCDRMLSVQVPGQ
ncbi:QRIC2 protein, partial [Nesospiza acunhae]|nr:QRIC2 protein [Nesospiza acunhae]